MQLIVLDREGKAIKEALKVLRQGGLVVFPSDTVYGLLVDATNEKAVQKLIDFKNRPPGKPISVFVADLKMLEDQVEVNGNQKRMIREILPGPFTLVLTSKHRLSSLLESEKGTLGVRIPDYQPVNSLVSRFGKPVTATSANLSGRFPHYQVESLLKELPKKKKELIDLIVNAGKLPKNKPSTIIDLTAPKIKIIRQGDVALESQKSFISRSPSQTKKVASYIVKKEMKKSVDRPIIFIIEGELGVGKTIFVKGAGEYFSIKNIVSPTFVVYYEYDINNPVLRKFIHFDLYNIQEKEEFKYLGIENYLKRGNILFFEWGEKVGEIYPLLQKKGKIVHIKIEYIDETSRRIRVADQ